MSTRLAERLRQVRITYRKAAAAARFGRAGCVERPVGTIDCRASVRPEVAVREDSVHSEKEILKRGIAVSHSDAPTFPATISPAQ
jgi:hypothetical protein